MSEKYIAIVAKSFKKAGVKFVRISGGEPLLVYRKLPYAVREFLKYYSIDTNFMYLD